MRTVVDGIEHFCTQWGSKVVCDQCGDLYTTDTMLGRRWKDAEERAHMAEVLREEGWIVKGDHESHVCPKCLPVDY